MPLEAQEGTTRRFLQHFFSILDAREQQSASLARGEKEETSSLLQVRQRTAIGNLFPEWVRMLLTQPPSQSKASVHVDKSGRGGGASAGATSYYLDSDMAERWFAFPHLSLISSAWATQRVPPPLRVTRHRLLHHLQRRYESSTNEGEKRGVFADDFMRCLSQHSGSDGRSVEYLSFMNAVQSLFPPHHPSSQCHQHPPVALVAAALFSEWCAVAEGGDASFASTRVPLKVIADDLAADTAMINSPACEPVGGVNTLVVVGTLAGLACAHPMTTATRAGSDKGFPEQQGRKRGRVGDSDDEYDDDDDDEEEEEGEEEEDEEDEYGSDDNVDGDDGADDEESNKSNTKTDVSGDLWRLQRRQLNTLIRRNTTAFRVPLASLLLNIFHVRHDGTGDAVMERHVTPAYPGEVHFRRGELRWFSVGESKRHRNMLESK
ncbi:hypothetical protein MOQ_005539 [Trypanosoma cruzi marinkellei]|uniref:Uncharacterized protein n=1 Tax=Trypanosoma cruzi marinkellei TaxID=85056 RepID=K2N7I5_TRYCR|nr:hypothetical protein MOQ_005539 [Trypanosoma cruzi marinkellei]